MVDVVTTVEATNGVAFIVSRGQSYFMLHGDRLEALPHVGAALKFGGWEEPSPTEVEAVQARLASMKFPE